MANESKLSMADKMLKQALKKEEQGDTSGADTWLEKPRRRNARHSRTADALQRGPIKVRVTMHQYHAEDAHSDQGAGQTGSRSLGSYDKG